MSILQRLRTRLAAPAADASLSQAERLLRCGGAVVDIRVATTRAHPIDDVGRAWRLLYLGDLDQALEPAYRAANARPYDVDSRIVHGTVRLARNDLDHAAHEFDQVIEEFGAEADAADGRRAVILARGFAPLDDIPASEREWEAAATLLTTLWRVCEIAGARYRGLASGHQDGRALIGRALTAGRARDRQRGESSESGHGTV